MTRQGRACLHGAHLLCIVPLVLMSWPAASPAQAGGERILDVAKNAVYGGATGLLLGGVLTLVVPVDKRDDVVRWGVVIGTFVGFGYGLYEARGEKDGFSERVRERAEARAQARLAAREADGKIAPTRAVATQGGSNPTMRAGACRRVSFPRFRDVGERPEPAMGGAAGRTSW
jgi:hypothetical protein